MSLDPAEGGHSTNLGLLRAWTHPMPGGEYSSHVVQYHKLDYEPTFYDGLVTPWAWMDTYSFAGAKPFWFFGTFGDMPSWSTIIQGRSPSLSQSILLRTHSLLL